MDSDDQAKLQRTGKLPAREVYYNVGCGGLIFAWLLLTTVTTIYGNAGLERRVAALEHELSDLKAARR